MKKKKKETDLEISHDFIKKWNCIPVIISNIFEEQILEKFLDTLLNFGKSGEEDFIKLCHLEVNTQTLLNLTRIYIFRYFYSSDAAKIDEMSREFLAEQKKLIREIANMLVNPTVKTREQEKKVFKELLAEFYEAHFDLKICYGEEFIGCPANKTEQMLNRIITYLRRLECLLRFHRMIFCADNKTQKFIEYEKYLEAIGEPQTKSPAQKLEAQLDEMKDKALKAWIKETKGAIKGFYTAMQEITGRKTA